MTVFRYIFLYHEQKLLQWHIKPKVSLSMSFIKNVMLYVIFYINKGSCLLFLEFFPSLLTIGNYFAIYDYLYILFFLHLSTTLLGYKSDERLQNHDHILCKFSDILP